MSHKNRDECNRWRNKTGNLCEIVGADQAGLYHPAAAGKGGDRPGKSPGIQGIAGADSGCFRGTPADRGRGKNRPGAAGSNPDDR